MTNEALSTFTADIAQDFFAALAETDDQEKALDIAIHAKQQRNAESFERIIDDMHGERALAGIFHERAIEMVAA